jgi:hypothetical protein
MEKHPLFQVHGQQAGEGALHVLLKILVFRDISLR